VWLSGLSGFPVFYTTKTTVKNISEPTKIYGLRSKKIKILLFLLFFGEKKWGDIFALQTHVLFLLL